MRRTRVPALLACSFAAALGLLAPGGTAAGQSPAAVEASLPGLPPVRHVFVVNLENEGYTSSFGAGSAAPYLSRTLRGQGALLTHYYGVAHHSLPNYIAQISGQAPDRATQGDCRTYSRFVRTGTTRPGQAVGHGCVYPANVPTLPQQLSGHRLTWRGYMEDMGRGCRHPRLGARDRHRIRPGDQYATKHNPFVYFRAITGRASCASHDVDLSHLRKDLSSRNTTRNLSYITPNLCDDGHDSPCVDGRSGGLGTADRWLRHWVPLILGSPAFRTDGLLVVTFDEADSGDASACCGSQAGPNASSPGLRGPGGGRVGAVLVSPFIRPGTTSSTPYNHYSLLRTVEDLFRLGHLGYARRAQPFGTDVFVAAG
jgi:hypothetical protein